MNHQNNIVKDALSSTLKTAIQHHQAGRLQEAERLYRGILAIDQKHPDANYYLGVMAVQGGHTGDGLHHLRTALEANPANGQFWVDYIDALDRAGQWELARQILEQGRSMGLGGDVVDKLAERLAARKSIPAPEPSHEEVTNLGRLYDAGSYAECERQLRIKLIRYPGWGPGWRMLADVVLRQGRFQDAVPAAKHAVDLLPQDATAYAILGISLQNVGLLAESDEIYKKALAIDPGFFEVHCNRGNVLKMMGRLNEAEDSYRKALEIRPHSAEINYNLGVFLLDRCNIKEAEGYLRKAVGANPGNHDAVNKLGYAFFLGGNLQEAETCYRMVLETNNECGEAHGSLGAILHKQGRLQEARTHYVKAISINEDDARAHYHHSDLLLLHGNLCDGWNEYEYRLKLPELQETTKLPPMQRWDGSDISGKTIFVYGEQGFGDSLQFLRYVYLLAHCGASVILAVPAELLKLVQPLVDKGVVNQVFHQADQIPHFHTHTPLLSLPKIFGTTLENIPCDVPYIHSDSSLVGTWLKRLQDVKGLRVGLVWSGSPSHGNDRNRSLSLSALAPLAAIPGVSFVSVQKGPAASQVADSPFPILHLGDEIQDFADTAAILANLDLLITVDTSVAHLGGAMCIPTWILLPFVPDWRWLLDREDSPWYPTVRLFRQKTMGNWQEVIGRVTEALRESVSNF